MLSSRKNGFPSVRAINSRLRGLARFAPDQDLKELIDALGCQGIDAKLPVVSLTAPVVLIFWTVIDEQKQPSRRQALDQVVEQSLGLFIDPVKVLEQDEWLNLTFPEEQAFDTVRVFVVGAVADPDAC